MELNLEDDGFRAILREVHVRGRDRIRLMIEYPPTDAYRARVRQALAHILKAGRGRGESEQTGRDG
jgi:hypothetical protein